MLIAGVKTVLYAIAKWFIMGLVAFGISTFCMIIDGVYQAEKSSKKNLTNGQSSDSMVSRSKQARAK